MGALFCVERIAMREIASASNTYIKELRSLKEKKYREKLGEYMIEGEKTVLEALNGAVLVESVITSSPENQVVKQAEDLGLDVVLVPRKLLEQIGDTKTPPDVLACIRRSTAELQSDGKFFVAADAVSDPKNLGTIIRTADAVGADGVVLSPECADPYGPKCQRAAMGSMFHISVVTWDLGEFLDEFKAKGGMVVAGMLEGSDTLGDSFEKVCVVVGNESRGVGERVRERTDIAYRIPIYGKCESLNAAVAAGIMMYDTRRRLK